MNIFIYFRELAAVIHYDQLIELRSFEHPDEDPTYKFITLANNIPMYEEETDSEYASFPYWGANHV